ncbi:ATP-dependent nuclease [Pseudarthrobacter oxydans]|uniref:ATP-dependent nuclease n=1 Tax=Pseudarthrobacter oxydans TaxID=1671 RepID=UPI0037F66C71
MIKSLRLTMFKGFKSYSVSFSGSALLLGPNNAGKSTLIAAIRLCNEAARFTTRNRPQEYFSTSGKTIAGYFLGKIRTDSFNLENVRHEFSDNTESRLELRYTSGAILRIIWPADDPAFFWLEHKGSHVQTAAAAKALVSVVGIVPTLTPLERNEKRLSAVHLKGHLETRLSSRHFRNHLVASEAGNPDDHRGLVSFLLMNTPEITSLELTSRRVDGEDWLDIFYMDGSSRTEKEIFWAGDGIQIWLQLLYHLWRNRNCASVLLDEPDVFLHPDLQRRLVRVVEAANQQVIMSSHAAEVASEAQPSTLVWIERTATSAVRSSTQDGLALIADGLGSSFNLSMARALKARNALFVEGQDMKILRVIAERLGCTSFALERNLAIIPIGGFSRWPSVESFSWLSSQYMGGNINIRLILDRDYRHSSECQAIERSLAASGVNAHVWQKKELESYLITPLMISAVTKLAPSTVESELEEIASHFFDDVFGQYSSGAAKTLPAHYDESTKITAALREFRLMWDSNLNQRLSMLPPKDLITAWNRRTQQTKFPALSARKLATAVSPETLDWEMVELLRNIEAELG